MHVNSDWRMVIAERQTGASEGFYVASLDDIFANLAVADIAKKLSVDEVAARFVGFQTLLVLAASMGVNAAKLKRTVVLEKILTAHSDGLVGGRVNLDDIDSVEDGKIVTHVFGKNILQTVNAIGGGNSGGAGASGGLGGCLAACSVSARER